MLLQGAVLNIKLVLQPDGRELNVLPGHRITISSHFRPALSPVCMPAESTPSLLASALSSIALSACRILTLMRALQRLSGFAPASESGHDRGRVSCGKL